MEDVLYNDLLVELECPICTNYMSPPIRQCATGHSVCEPCRQRLECCALCQGRFTESRNLSLEALAVKMRYPCINKPSGCPSILAYNERDVHELECSYKGFRCAMEKCSWVGKLEDIAAHWANKKMTSKPYHSSNVCHTKMKSESFYVNMIEAFDNYFWFKCKITNKKIYWAVQLIGNSKTADSFFYEIEVFKQGRTKRKILLSDYCQGIDLENSQLFKDGLCISISTETIESFVSDDLLLVYYMRVHPIKGTLAAMDRRDEAGGTEKMVKQRDRSKGPQSGRKEKYKRNQSVSGKKNPGKQYSADDDFIVL